MTTTLRPTRTDSSLSGKKVSIRASLLPGTDAEPPQRLGEALRAADVEVVVARA
ncbi:hypothetical protein ACI3EY_14975 [Ornithinimicrobium sp. LYQ92]|uniref:hypothetical protein n=1 Tax=Serinicoccus sp. LYQ92 TaxID=3378798 RepID=UPI00385363D3